MTNNQTIDGVLVSRELLERTTSPFGDVHDKFNAIQELRALLDADRCTSCDGSGDLIDLTGEWRGYCVCPAGVELKNRPVPAESLAAIAKKYDDTLLPFLALMRKELHANADKGDRPGWLSMTADTCMLEIIYHFGKLQASVKRGDGDRMAEYGADVANLCMMLLDICGVINLVRHSEQPAPVAVVQTCKIGIYGKAYDLPETKRAYTYADQPGNVEASKLGSAARSCSPGGDSIDHGLSLLKALSDQGFGVFEIACLNTKE